MSFTSFAFLLFITGAFLLYFITPKRFKYVTLLVVSLVFYYIVSSGIVIYLLITIFTIYLGARLLQRCNASIQTLSASESMDVPVKKIFIQSFERRKRIILITVLVLNFGILAVFRYSHLLDVAVHVMLSDSSFRIPDFASLVFIVGISFYTFQSTGYLIDVYRGKYEPERNVLKFALFVSFFPQIIQGPIGHYDKLAKQLYKPHAFDFDRAKNGILLIGWGFVKKLIVADRLAVFVNTVYSQPTDYAGSVILLGALVYGLQIYCDFSAGINIAHGVAEVMGIQLEKNFNQPYYANSISDYWRRWHITLGHWMRDYLFFPLALSPATGKLSRVLRARLSTRWSKAMISGTISFLVFTVVGIWHGGETKYILYGFWNGGLIMLSIISDPLFVHGLSFLHIKPESKGWRGFRIVRTILLVSIGRIFICSPDGTNGLRAIWKMIVSFQPSTLLHLDPGMFGMHALGAAAVIIVLVLVFWFDHVHEAGGHIRTSLAGKPIVIRWLVYFSIIFALLMLIPDGVDPSGFIYARF